MVHLIQKLATALYLIARGIPVHPLHTPTPGAVAFDGSPRPCSCNAPPDEDGNPTCSVGKHPRTPHGCKDATTDPGRVRGWWQRLWPSANVGIATGHPLPDGGDLVVIDLDEGGEESFASMCEELYPFPETFTVRTGSGGRHLYTRSRRPIRTRTRVLPGIDVRGVGGYVVAPGSLHVSGEYYVVESGTLDQIAWLPDEWHDILEPAASSPEGGYVATPPDEWITLITNGIAEGGRNNAVARLAGYLFCRGLDGRVALALIAAWNDARNRPPLGTQELEATVRSIAAREIAKRQETNR